MKKAYSQAVLDGKIELSRVSFFDVLNCIKYCTKYGCLSDSKTKLEKISPHCSFSRLHIMRRPWESSPKALHTVG